MQTDIREVATQTEAAACYAVMALLRPQFETPQAFADAWRELSVEGYRLLALHDEGHVRALAGFRIGRNIAHGKHLYVDDLITDESGRGNGYGAALMDRLRQEARTLGCRRLLLDTPVANFLGHKFYYRQGLFATALRFTQDLA